MKKKIARRVAALLCSLLLLPIGSLSAEPAAGEAEAADAALLPAGTAAVLENARFRLEVDTQTGRFGLFCRESGVTWWSTPEAPEEDAIANGKTQMEMQSNLLIEYADIETEELERTNSYVAAGDGGVIVKAENDRIVIGYKMNEYRLYVPLELTLADNGLCCRVLTDGIMEGGNYRLYALTLLPYFGAAGKGDTGYLFVPDGSGAIIRFDNSKAGLTQYRASLYGRNYTSDRLTDSQTEQPSRLPVYGICKNGSSVLAVIDKGSALAELQAEVGGRSSERSRVCAEFSLRAAETYYSGQSLGSARKVTLLDTGGIRAEDIAVRFLPVSATDGEGYVGMAKTYRRVLTAQGMKKPAAYTQEVHIQLLGAVRKTEHFLGIPYEATVTVTSCAEAEALLRRLEADGIDNAAVRYLNWNSPAVRGKVSDKVSVIGGKAGLLSLCQTAEETGIAVYPDNEFTVARSFSLAYPRWSHAARTLGRKPVMVYPYSFVHFFKDNLTAPKTLLAPRTVSALFARFTKRYEKLGIGALGIGETAETLSADFGPDGWTRESSLTAMQTLAQTAAQTNELLVSGGNAYALPYARRVMNAPVQSSGYDAEDSSVPFYQIALYGYIPTSGSPVNFAEEDASHYLLRALESGSSLSFYWTAADSRELKGSVYENRFSTKIDVWYDKAAEFAGVLKAFSAKVSDSDIAGHECLSRGVYRTTWDNGVSVTVNYTRDEVAVDGRPLAGGGYRIEEGNT